MWQSFLSVLTGLDFFGGNGRRLYSEVRAGNTSSQTITQVVTGSPDQISLSRAETEKWRSLEGVLRTVKCVSCQKRETVASANITCQEAAFFPLTLEIIIWIFTFYLSFKYVCLAPRCPSVWLLMFPRDVTFVPDFRNSLGEKEVNLNTGRLLTELISWCEI